MLAAVSFSRVLLVVSAVAVLVVAVIACLPLSVCDAFVAASLCASEAAQAVISLIFLVFAPDLSGCNCPIGV